MSSTTGAKRSATRAERFIELAIVVVDVVEEAHVFFFLHKSLGDPHPLDRLIQVGVDAGEADPHLSPSPPDPAADPRWKEAS